MIEPQIKLDYSGLTAGINAASKYSKRTMPEIVNTAAYWIAVNTKNDMPFVGVPKIDAELGVIYQNGFTPKGRPSKAKKNRVITFGQGDSRTEGKTLAELIVLASMNQNSNYNARTHGRWQRDFGVLAGLDKAGRQAKIFSIAQKMTKTRHSSGKFLIAGWVPAVMTLRPFAVQKFQPTAQPLTVDTITGTPKGSATPAEKEGLNVSAEIENDIGGTGKNAASYNNALHLYGEPILQSAINGEGQKNMEYALKKMDSELGVQTAKYWA